MATNKRCFWSLKDTAEYKRGAEQLREWHEQCRMRRLRERMLKAEWDALPVRRPS